MFISKTNQAKNITPIIREGAGNNPPSNMTNPDFSVFYQSSAQRLVISFGAQSNVDYVGIAAQNTGAGTGRIAVRDGQDTPTYNSVIGQYNVEREHVTMFCFERRSFTDMIIVIDSERASALPLVRFLAFGQAVNVPNGGEVSGFGYNELTRAVQSRTITGETAAPIGNLIKRQPLRGNLSLPNMRKEWVLTEWQQVQDLAVSQPFFICAQDGVITDRNNNDAWRSVLCFDPQFRAPTAHSATRALMDVNLSFRCYNGL